MSYRELLWLLETWKITKLKVLKSKAIPERFNFVLKTIRDVIKWKKSFSAKTIIFDKCI